MTKNPAKLKMNFNVAIALLIYIVLVTGFHAERQCGDESGKGKHIDKSTCYILYAINRLVGVI